MLMRQGDDVLPHQISLLFGCGELGISSVQLVLNFEGHGFAVVSYCNVRTTITFPSRLSVSSIAFFPMLFTETLVIPGSPL